MEEIRLQKYLANNGVASRRKCEELIKQGRIKVNGKIVTELGTKIEPNKDIIEYNGKAIKNTSQMACMIAFTRSTVYLSQYQQRSLRRQPPAKRVPFCLYYRFLVCFREGNQENFWNHFWMVIRSLILQEHRPIGLQWKVQYNKKGFI